MQGVYWLLLNAEELLDLSLELEDSPDITVAFEFDFDSPLGVERSFSFRKHEIGSFSSKDMRFNNVSNKIKIPVRPTPI